MKKRRRYLTIIIALCVLVAGFAAGIVYVNSKLPNDLTLTGFAKGVVGVGIKNEPFVEVEPNTFFFKDGNLEKVNEALGERSVIFNEQFGSALIFEQGEQEIHGKLQAVTRWHYLLTLEVEPTE